MTTSNLSEKISETKAAATKAAAKGAEMAKDVAGKAKDEAVAFAEDAAATVRETAVDGADAARETLADTGDRLARTLQDTADDIQGVGAKVMSGAAGGLSTAANTLRSHSVDDLLGAAKDFAKRHPGAFAAGAAVAGFALARFFRASTQAATAEQRAMARADGLYHDAARRTVDRLGNGGERS